ncbi:MAG: ATP-grasp domain-containing protein [Candidatus Saccharibacteria bacterium]
MRSQERLAVPNPEANKYVHNPSLVIVHNALEVGDDDEETIGFEVRNAINVNKNIASCEVRQAYVVDDEKMTLSINRTFNKQYTLDRQADAIFRGGIMNQGTYRKFYDECLNNGLKLINSPEQSEFVQSFDSYYPYIKPFTFESVVIKPDFDVVDIVAHPEKRKKLQVMMGAVMSDKKWANTFVRFDNMSLKNEARFQDRFQNDESSADNQLGFVDNIAANVISTADDINSYINLIMSGLNYGHKYRFHFPLVLREYKKPKYIQGTTRLDNTLRRVENEYRAFVYKGEVVDTASYSIKSMKFEDDVIQLINKGIEKARNISQQTAINVAKAPNAPDFYSLDVLELSDGTFKVVEINEGQNSGIYSSYLDKFYRRFGKDINPVTKSALSKTALSHGVLI